MTTDANDLLALIHNSKKRMPVVLDRDAEKKWISSGTSDDEALSLLKACPEEVLKAHMISNLINNKSANRNTPEVIKPFSRQDSTLFG